VFTPLSKNTAETVRRNGKIDFIISPGWSGRESCMSVPHSIIYSKNDSPMHSSVYLFYCNIISGKTTAVNNVEATRNILARPMAYLFLEMSVDAMEDLAKKNKSNRLIISATVPGFAEIVFDRNFHVEWQEDGNLFKATKKLEQQIERRTQEYEAN